MTFFRLFFQVTRLLEETNWGNLKKKNMNRVFHLRTTILPAEEEMPEIMESFKKFNDEFMDQYEDQRGYSRM